MEKVIEILEEKLREYGRILREAEKRIDAEMIIYAAETRGEIKAAIKVLDPKREVTE